MFEFDRQQILAIAKEAVSRRRHLGSEDEVGFVEHADYNECLRRLICQGKLDPINEGRCLREIEGILLDPNNEPQDRYRCVKISNKSYFYPLQK